MFFKPVYAFLSIAFLTPFSVGVEISSLGSAISLPTELLLPLFLFVFVLRFLILGDFPRDALKHPITLVILFSLLWILVTSLTSTMIMVSIKFFMSRLWFVVAAFFMGILAFRDKKNIYRFIFLFGSALAVIVIITTIKHSAFYFDNNVAGNVTPPFIKDHTIYGAVTALIFPLMFGLFFKSKELGLSRPQRILALILAGLIAIGAGLSFSRAAWLSLAVSAIFVGVFLLKVKFRGVVILSLFGALLLAFFWGQIVLQMRTSDDAVSDGDLQEQISSIGNVTTDASNTERINRWNCAVRMFREKPFLGWGPGTYMFQYAPFQIASERTIISTNFGTLGNAHSEYLGPLAESGALGFISMILLVVLVIYKAMYLYYYGKNKEIRILSMLVMLSLVTYFTHGVLNNFLHTDKASIPFWGFIAILVSLDLRNKKNKYYEE